tara:strand:+ start:86 stop:436 length:351 start_codon:yes stop_codon:yes gene_type:complete
MRSLVLALTIILLLTSCNDDDKEDTVLVFKYKSSVQCAPDSGILLDDMAADLTAANIKVLCAADGHDGNVAITLCGAETGEINVYEITKSALINAENLGFSNLSALQDANVVMACQ